MTLTERPVLRLTCTEMPSARDIATLTGAGFAVEVEASGIFWVLSLWKEPA